MELPKNNHVYSQKQYWQQRFTKQEQYDWLGQLTNFQKQLFQYDSGFIQKNKNMKILILGCGNSTLSYDLLNYGYSNILSIDYSQNVIQKMKKKYQKNQQLKWMVQDMRNMDKLHNQSFDFILEKGALDAFMAGQGDVWDPNANVLKDVHSALSQIRRILKPTGVYCQISFQQPHFRKRYLLKSQLGEDITKFNIEQNLYKWRVQTKGLSYGLGYFIYFCKPF